MRRGAGNRKLECLSCGRKFEDAYASNERAVRDLPVGREASASRVKEMTLNNRASLALALVPGSVLVLLC